jgi:SlyX protein
MDTEIKIEEKISLLQLELSQMSDEIYNQQKEIVELKLQFNKLKFELQNFQDDNVITSNQVDKLPPHY